MVKDVLVLTDAENDLDTGKEFYDLNEPGVGEYFWDSLIADIESLTIYAGIHREEFGFHRMFAKRFPYAIYYYVKNEIAYVTAVLPIRRNPAWIQSQLTQRS